ncbi:MAG: HlyD family efflux transporter periplasmic adaptor subunit, partial [Akkermansiaceae bacterium]|nr:HlyD family efflux transporter periplasmic adaptor subunit [Akkermansiaceae bacterium]
MSLDQLKNTDSDAPGAPRRRRGRSWLLPGALLVGFVIVFALLFGKRLLPAVPVSVAPVITLRSSASDGSSAPATGGTRPADDGTAEDAEPPPPGAAAAGPLLFQASGWVEPDPYVTYATTLINGIIDKVRVLEGETVKKDQTVATLIDDDARLDVQEARRRLLSLDAQRDAHCAAIPVLEAQIAAARKSIVAEETRLAELEDSAHRLKKLPPGAVPALDLSQALLKVERQVAVVAESAAEIPRLEAAIRKIDAEREALDARQQELETELARKQLALDRTVVKAPIDGIVLRLHAAPGKKRMLDMDDPKSAVVVELYDPEKLQARIDVPLTEAAGLAVGQPVRLTTDLLPNAEFNATVTRIVGEADLQRNTLQVKVRIHDPDPRLRPEMLVRAAFYPPASGASAAPAGNAARGSASSGRLTLFAPVEALVGPS